MKINRRFLFKFHRWLGLILAFNFFILSLSGVILIWREELILKKNVTDISLLLSDRVKALNKVEFYLKKEFPDKKILAIFKDEDEQIHARLGVRGQTEFKNSKRLQFDEQGSITENIATDSSWITWILKLHRELLLGSTGKILVGLLGLFLILTLNTGLLMPFKQIKKIDLRQSLGALHKKIGFSIFAWSMIICLSGTILAFNSTIIALFLNSSLKNGSTSQMAPLPLSPISLELLLKNLENELPTFTPDFISYPNNEFSLPENFAVLMENETDKKVVFLSSKTGEITKLVSPPWYIKLLLMSEPLHFGNYGGIALKIIWTLFGLALSILPLSGILIFVDRKGFISLRKYKISLNKKSLEPLKKREILIISNLTLFFILSIFATDHFIKLVLTFTYVLFNIVLFKKYFFPTTKRLTYEN